MLLPSDDNSELKFKTTDVSISLVRHGDNTGHWDYVNTFMKISDFKPGSRTSIGGAF
jgi:hypothetical protein